MTINTHTRQGSLTIQTVSRGFHSVAFHSGPFTTIHLYLLCMHTHTHAEEFAFTGYQLDGAFDKVDTFSIGMVAAGAVPAWSTPVAQ